MAPKKILDLDLELGEDDEPTHTRPFRLFGREWTLVCAMNTFAFADMTTGDPAAVVRFIDSMLLPAERSAFHEAMSSKPLSGERLNKILEMMMEAAAERPTSPPSASRPGRTSQTSVRKSAGATSRQRARR